MRTKIPQKRVKNLKMRTKVPCNPSFDVLK